MDDHFGFPPPIESPPSLTWEQILSKENHWANLRRPHSCPSFSSGLTNDGGHSLCFKTQMCRRFKSGRCPNGDSCNFAHSIEEIRGPRRSWPPHEDYNSSSYTQNPSNPNCRGRFKQSEEQKHNKTKVQVCGQSSEDWKTNNSSQGWSTRHRRQKYIYGHGDAEPLPFQASPKLTEHVAPKTSEQPASSLPRLKGLTLEKSKRIYGDWIDD